MRVLSDMQSQDKIDRLTSFQEVWTSHPAFPSIPQSLLPKVTSE